ncbi:hypothetical protein CONLIGDRAFT_69375 [Coniochaeta ligniaria NRRL 30616]|uniref:Zn(2)-C6 fungal-type domain-containing protein n=1 Tax=Coniochaeta ligniaria NRRL 30616 TaxID=1408157 RepID=A0A1J7IUM7_9PEZI|nr:hypothetical protein CONLIGDRAFT_69375 [Coniochaeta ligniaria NRRL 30616]
MRRALMATLTTMDTKVDPSVPEDVMMQQGYQSPSADASDTAGFYGTQSRDQDISDVQEPLETQQPREQTSPDRQQSGTSVSAEELQLAAQLTQGLAPMMAAHNQAQEQQLQQVQDAEMQPREQSYEHHTQDVDFQDQQDLHDQVQEPEPDYDDHVRDPEYQAQVQRDTASLHQQLQTQLADHERELQNILREQAQAQSAVDTHYAAPSITPSHLQQQHIPLGHLGQQYQMQDSSIPPRKRSKVSRACDECRRKKIKCDAQSDGGDEPCSNCRRSSSPCLFSRIPQKRGPSKGYIKELADRINSIEGKLGGGADLLESVSRRESAEAFSSPLPIDNGRKRPFSSISNDTFPAPSPARHTGWVPDHRPIQPYLPSPNRDTSYSANGLAPQPIGPKADPPRLETQVADSMQLDTVMGELNEVTWRIYESSIQQTFPILASRSFRVQALIAPCAVHLREAFLEAFYAALKHTQELPPGTSGDTRTANKLLTEWETDNNTRSYQTDLVHLQTLLLMAIETDSHGPASVKGHHGGLPKGSFIGRALALAYSMGLQTTMIDLNPEELDVDMEDNIAMRAWWSLVMLDRWNAIGAALPAQIPADTAVILPVLKSIMGEGPYALMHLSQLLSNFVPMALTPPKRCGHTQVPTLSSWVNLAIESFRLNLPPSITPDTHPVVHLAYWHCRLLAYLLMPSALSTDVFWAAKEIVKLLVRHSRLRSPLNHHFSSLVTAALIKLSEVAKTHDEAIKLLRELHDKPFAQSAWDGAIMAALAETLTRPETSSGIASHNLQHLADLATATTDLAAAAAAAVATDDNTAPEEVEEAPIKYRTMSDYEDLGFDPRPMLRAGYLNYFATGEAGLAAE